MPAAAPPGQVNGAAPNRQWPHGQQPAAGVYSGVPASPGNATTGPEHTGSLTGHIPRQGPNDDPASGSSAGRAVLILLVVVGILALAGVAIAAVVGGLFQ